MKKAITEKNVVAALKFIAENRTMSTNELARGLELLGYGWSFNDWHVRFDETSVNLFEGMRRGLLSSGASVVINMGSGNDYNRNKCDDHFLSTDNDTSVYHFVRLVTGDNSFTKENIER